MNPITVWLAPEDNPHLENEISIFTAQPYKDKDLKMWQTDKKDQYYIGCLIGNLLPNTTDAIECVIISKEEYLKLKESKQ